VTVRIVSAGAGFDLQAVDFNDIADRFGAAYRRLPSGMNGSGGDAGLARRPILACATCRASSLGSSCKHFSASAAMSSR